MNRKLTSILNFEAQAHEALSRCMTHGQPTPSLEATLNNPGSRSNGMTLEFRAVPCHDEQGQLTGFRGTLTDISERKSAEQKATYLSMHDELTGLPNRRALVRDLQQAMERARVAGNTIVVAGIDLDGFKSINDAYGHGTGDQLLNQVADRLNRFLRPVDLAYRTGGDEFIVLFDAFDSQIASEMAQAVSSRLITDLSEPYAVGSLKVQIGASIGLSRFPEDDYTVDDLLRKADMALYVAKDAGKGCVVSFDPQHDKDAEFQRTLEQDLRQAISENQFHLMYQPQVDTFSEQIIGYEALLRWTHPDRGLISPADFIPVAEKLNMMEGIGEFVLDSACQFAATWPANEDGSWPQISVNVSPKQLQSSHFVELVRNTLDRHHLKPDRLELEITEEVLVDDFKKTTGQLRELRDLGVAIAIDDFGSGQTSLRYLNQFPLTTIKIDRSFIRHLGQNEKASEITRTIVNLGHKLGINVIAEGVEQTDQLNILKRWKCNQIQGFLFYQPLSQTDALAHMNSTPRHKLGKTG